MVHLVDGTLYTSDNNELKEYKYNIIDKDIISLHLLDYFFPLVHLGLPLRIIVA